MHYKPTKIVSRPEPEETSGMREGSEETENGGHLRGSVLARSEAHREESARLRPRTENVVVDHYTVRLGATVRAHILCRVNDAAAAWVFAVVLVPPGALDLAHLPVTPCGLQGVPPSRRDARLFKDLYPYAVADATVEVAVVCPKARKALADPLATPETADLLQREASRALFEALLAVVYEIVAADQLPALHALEPVLAVAPDLSTTKPPAKGARAAICAARSLPSEACLVAVAHGADLRTEGGFAVAVPAARRLVGRPPLATRAPPALAVLPRL